MTKLSNLILGPELLWLIFYFIVLLIIKLTGSPVKSMDNFWVNTSFIIPIVGVLLTFGLYYFPGVNHSWLLLRIWLACVIIGHFVLSTALGAHSEQGPGVGTAYIMGMGFIFIILIGGSIFAAIKFR